MTPAGLRGPPPLLPPDRPVLRGRTAARCQPGGNKGNLLYVGWQSGLQDQTPPPPPLPEPLMLAQLGGGRGGIVTRTPRVGFRDDRFRVPRRWGEKVDI
jgi:hypothetical protein